MKSKIIQAMALYVILVLLMVTQKPVFMLLQDSYSAADMSMVPSVIWHGLPMDFCMAAYLMVVPALLIIASIWTRRSWVNLSMNIYFGLMAVAVASVTVTDAALYPYWGFRIDTTPIFYFLTSPASAMASIQWWQWIAGGASAIVYALVIFILCRIVTCPRNPDRNPHKVLTTIVLSILTAALFIPIRGGFTVSTMNLSRSYFSREMRFNHAAINPMFSLMYSAAHQNDFAGFEYFSEDELDTIWSEMEAGKEYTETHSPLVSPARPDIILVILESFSNHLLPIAGGEPIALQLDSVAREGLFFSDFYAASFRTDRALPAILCGFPAQPKTSLLKYVDKLDQLPSIPASLKSLGYDMTYYYGGDINFTNVNAMLQSAGFDRVVSDKDFPITDRLSKWGVHDEKVWQRMLTDIMADKCDSIPKLRVIQTSSSHEPFEVPYSANANPRINSFMYADSCLGDFIRSFRQLPDWDRSLVVITSDHYGVYPENLTDMSDRHKVPLVIAGGAADSLTVAPELLALPASQTDMASTLLHLLGADASQFPFSHNLLDSTEHRMAFFCEPSWFALKTPEGYVSISTDSDDIMESEGNEKTVNQAKAYMQTIYKTLRTR